MVFLCKETVCWAYNENQIDLTKHGSDKTSIKKHFQITKWTAKRRCSNDENNIYIYISDFFASQAQVRHWGNTTLVAITSVQSLDLLSLKSFGDAGGFKQKWGGVT